MITCNKHHDGVVVVWESYDLHSECPLCRAYKDIEALENTITEIASANVCQTHKDYIKKEIL